MGLSHSIVEGEGGMSTAAAKEKPTHVKFRRPDKRSPQDTDNAVVHPVFDVYRPTMTKLSETLTKFSGEDTEDEGAFSRWLCKLESGCFVQVE